MKKLQTLKGKLQAAGLEVSEILLNIDGKPTKGLKINTDYEGPYPPQETFEKLETARRIAKGWHVEKRGHYVAVFIW
mgnify:CR=1 FL=1